LVQVELSAVLIN